MKVADAKSGVDPLSLLLLYKNEQIGAVRFDPKTGVAVFPIPKDSQPLFAGPEFMRIVAADFQETKNVSTPGDEAMPNTRFLGTRFSVVARPVATWIAPTKGACVRGKTELQVHASSPAAISSVGFFDGKRQLARVRKSDQGIYRANWQAGGARKGRHELDGRSSPTRPGASPRPYASSASAGRRKPLGRSLMRVAVVTGGSSGIGAALARRLKSRGWQCVLVARGAERLVRVADELGAEHEVCDVGDREAVERMAAAVMARHPQIGLLVNNAGIPGRTGFLDADPERIEDVTRVNYLGGVWCLRAFLPALEAARPSHVVNVVSVAGAVSGAGTSGLYAASKHAQLAFSRSVAAELEPRGIRVHTVLPGFAETDGFPQRDVLPRHAHRFVIEADDVAEAIMNAVERNRREVHVPHYYRLATLAQAAVPGLVARLGRGMNKPA